MSATTSIMNIELKPCGDDMIILDDIKSFEAQGIWMKAYVVSNNTCRLPNMPCQIVRAEVV